VLNRLPIGLPQTARPSSEADLLKSLITEQSICEHPAVGYFEDE
jgi:hypothetical protein